MGEKYAEHQEQVEEQLAELADGETENAEGVGSQHSRKCEAARSLVS